MTLDQLQNDVRLALRSIRRSPGFSIIAIAALALGLGATTAMFSVVDSVLLRPLKYRDSGRLYVARTIAPPQLKITTDLPVNARHFHQWRTQCRSCEEVALAQFQDLTLVGAGDPVRLPALKVSSNFFRTLGVQPSLGRDFLPGEEKPGPWDRVILSDGLWRSRFGADASIVGRKIQINGEAHTVVGVMPPNPHLPKGNEWGSFFGPTAAPMIFRPLDFDPSQARGAGSLNYSSVIRLKAGVEPSQAIAELNALLADFMREFKLETKTVLIPLQQQITRSAKTGLWLLMASIGAVLLIVCVNVGNLILVRTTGRYREAGIRMALGASRGGLFRLVLNEALVLTVIGGGGGIALAQAGLKLFVAWAPVGLPRLEEVEMDWRAMLFAGVTILLSTIVCGLLPAWRLANTQPIDSLKAASGGSTESGGKLRLRELMATVEVALSTVLLIAGGLLMLSFFRLMRVEKGFEVQHVITQDVSFLAPKYARGVRRYFVQEMIAKFAQIPGVRAVGAINQLPLRGEDWVDNLRDPDGRERPIEDSALANFRFVAPDYGKAAGLTLKQGRFIEESDKDQPRAMISERVARYLWPNENPIGRRVRGAGAQRPPLEVVGVVGEVRTGGLEQDPPMMVYEHYWRTQPIAISFVLRTEGNPAPVAGAIRMILSSADPEMAIPPARTMLQILNESVAARRFQMQLAVVFAVSALLLASLGIYGVISFTVARRTPEIGIRIALGAGGAQLMAMVMMQGMRPVAAGLTTGVCIALLGGRLIASQLYGVSPADGFAISVVVILLLVVGLCACWIPARRAMRIDPLAALRSE